MTQKPGKPHSLGKGEAECSNHSGGTTAYPGKLGIKHAQEQLRRMRTRADHSANLHASTGQERGSPDGNYSAHDRMRFWVSVEVGEPHECWPYTNMASGMGYGRFKIDGRLESAHRVAYQMRHGAIPKDKTQHHGIVVRHTCDNRRCCNPDHLRLGTQAENARDMSERGRTRRNVLTANDVRAIRADPRSHSELAAVYGVVQSTISKIKRRAIHKDVD